MEPPQIHYFPDFTNYDTRRKQRLLTEVIDFSLPDGFPGELKSSLVWDGKELQDGMAQGTPDWLYSLNERELREIDDALKHFLTLEVNFGLISPETFPLPTLHARLRGFSHEIHDVRGFVILRGVPVDKYSRSENIIIFAGITSHIGRQRGRQDHDHEGKPADVVLSHIKDLRYTQFKGSIGAPAYTNDMQVFHTDSGDMIALFMLEDGLEGGESQIASSWKVYNELVAERPDLVRTLAENWVVDRRKPETPYIERPLLYYQPASDSNPERIVLQCSRGSFTNFGALPRSPNIPPITEAQAEALDTIHFLAEKFSFSFKMEKGDIQYVNDFSILHARSAFRDDSEHSRHLIRIWFRDPEKAWSTPRQLLTRWNGVYGGVEPEGQVFPLEPYVRSPMNVSKIHSLKG